MKSLFDYINSNSFLATLIGIVVGWILNFISTMYFNKKEEKKKLKGKKDKSNLKISQNCLLKILRVNLI